MENIEQLIKDVNEPSKWGPIQKDLPPVNTIFKLGLYENDIPLTVYKLVALRGTTMILDYLSFDKWINGQHSWHLECLPNFSIYLANINSNIIKTNKIYNCIKCNVYNPYATANQSNDQYLCFECRT